MKVVMFIPFLIAAVSAHSQYMNGLMFRDPKAFVATFANADHDAINKVIEMVNGMIQTGKDEVAAATKKYNDAAAVAVEKDEALDVAQGDLIYAKGELEIVTIDSIAAQTLADLKETEEANALAAQNLAYVNLEILQYYLDDETARVTRERATLEEAIEILEDLKENKVPEGRRLLSAPSTVAFLANLASQGLKVDPQAVNSVLALIADILEENDNLQAAAESNVVDATASHEQSKVDYQDAIDAHVAAVNALGKKLEDKGMYESEVAKYTIVHTDAKDAKNAADNEAATLKETMHSEETRVAGENKDLEEVKDLLKGLL
jgi:hypothetical protein